MKAKKRKITPKRIKNNQNKEKQNQKESLVLKLPSLQHGKIKNQEKHASKNIETRRFWKRSPNQNSRVLCYEERTYLFYKPRCRKTQFNSSVLQTNPKNKNNNEPKLKNSIFCNQILKIKIIKNNRIARNKIMQNNQTRIRMTIN